MGTFSVMVNEHVSFAQLAAGTIAVGNNSPGMSVLINSSLYLSAVSLEFQIKLITESCGSNALASGARGKAGAGGAGGGGGRNTKPDVLQSDVPVLFVALTRHSISPKVSKSSCTDKRQTSLMQLLRNTT